MITATPRIDYHVVPQGQFWAVRQEGALSIERLAMTKAEAIGYGIEHAREGQVSLVIHKKNGQFQQVWSYDGATLPY